MVKVLPTTKTKSKVTTKAITKVAVKPVVKKKVATVTRTVTSRATTRTSSRKKSSLGSSTKNYGKRALKSFLLSRFLHVTSKVVVMLFIVGTAFYGAYSFVNNTFAGDVVISKSEIVARVGKLTTLPTSEEPNAVVRVQDAETLRKQNAFYQDVKEGDYILMYNELAVIYSLRTDSIVSLKRLEKKVSTQ